MGGWVTMCECCSQAERRGGRQAAQGQSVSCGKMLGGEGGEGGRGSPGKGQPPGTTTQQSKKGEEPPALAPTIFLLFSEKGYNTLEGLRVPYGHQ